MERVEVTITISDSGDCYLITLSGPLTITDMFEFQRILQADTARLTVVDLSGVPYVDSAGIGVLVNGYVSRKKTARTLALVGVRERVMNVLKVTRVDQFFPIFETVEQATTHLNPDAAGATS